MAGLWRACRRSTDRAGGVSREKALRKGGRRVARMASSTCALSHRIKALQRQRRAENACEDCARPRPDVRVVNLESTDVHVRAAGPTGAVMNVREPRARARVTTDVDRPTHLDLPCT